MIVRFIRDSIRRAPRRKALIVAAIAMGSAVATSMLGVMLSIGDKVNRELRSVGANIVVTQRSAALSGGVGGVTRKAVGTANYIAEADLPKIESIFWHLEYYRHCTVPARAGWRLAGAGCLVFSIRSGPRKASCVSTAFRLSIRFGR